MTPKKKSRHPLSRQEFIWILLIVLLIFNTAVHFAHPAYKFYRENVKKLFKENSLQFDEFRVRLIPVLTNQLEILRLSSTVTNYTSLSSSTNVSSLIPSDFSSDIPRRFFKPDRVFKDVEGFSFLYGGFVYSVGVQFDDGIITYISPTLVQTTTADYFLRPDFKDDKKNGSL